MLNFTTKPLGEIAAEITVGYVGPMLQEYVPAGVPFLRSLNVRRFKFDTADLKFIRKEFHQSIKKSALKPGDVVVVRTGNPGVACVIPDSLPDANCSDLVVIRPGSAMDPHFLCYYINAITASHIKGQLVGAIQQHFNVGAAKQIPFPVVHRNAQQRIAAVLKSLDDKIAINSQISDELEAVARLLYDYWFVQFDFPISAAQAAAMGNPRLEGKPYRASGCKMAYDKSLKREIPAEWLSGTVDEVFEFNPSVSLSNGTLAAYFDMDAVPTKGFITKPAQRKHFSGGTKFTNGDVVVARITPCLENGKTALITLLQDDEVACGSTEFIVLRGRKRPLSAFGGCLARSEHFRDFAIRNMTGTSGRKRIEASVLRTYPIAVPPVDLLTTFEEKCLPMFQLMTQNEKQNHELSALRDWLLPMLMNGQVTVN